MSNRTWFAERSWHLSAPLADCPACGGSGKLIREKHAETRCLSCRATGKVEVDRVCLDCKQFTAHCTCEGSRTLPRQKKPHKGRRG